MRVLASATSCIFLSAGVLLGQVPTGAQFQVNSYTSGGQYFPVVAMSSQGDFVVVWPTGFFQPGPDGDDTSIEGRRFDSDGVPLASEFQVNTYTTSAQVNPAVTAAPSGKFVVVWNSYGLSGGDSDRSGIRGQRFDSDGAFLGDEFLVNSYTTGGQRKPAVATAPDEGFIVVWWSDGSGGSDDQSSSIQGQIFDSDGARVGDEFQVNTYTPSSQRAPAVAVAPGGDFVVAWESYLSGGSDNYFSIQARLFDSGGNPMTTDFQVNTYDTGIQRGPAVAIAPEGNFVVVWQSDGSSSDDTSYSSIQSRFFDFGGNPLGGELQVNTYTTDDQVAPAVAIQPAGDIIVVWHSEGSSGSDTSFRSVQGQVFESSGAPIGAEFQINTYTTYSQRVPSVATDAKGGFVVVWDSNGSVGSDTSYFSIQGQRFRSMKIFADGFESGNASRWSAVVTP